MAKRYVLGPNAARKLAELLRGSGEVSRRQGPASALAFDSEYVAPFTVQWAQSADSGSGAWLVWLPSDKCLIVDGAAVDLTEELEAADDPYPTGWYVLEDVPASGGSVYLNVTPGDPEAAEEEDQVATAEFSASASQTEGDIPILVATVAKDSTTGAVTVKQTVTSALVFGTGKGDAETTPMPFDYVETESESNGETVVSKSLTRCQFYFDGELQTLSDYSGLPEGSGTVYLVCTGTFDDETGEYEWEFEVANEQGEESTGVKVVNIKLYDFADGKPSVDYRSTFLTVEGNAPPAKLTVAKPDGTCSILLDASGDSPKLVITDGTNTVSIDLADVAGDCGGSFGLHSFSYKDKNGDTQTYHGLFCDDIDLSDIQAGKTIKDVSVSASTSETVVTFTYSDDSTTEIHIPHGKDGEDGEPGDDGEAPEITAEKNGATTHIFADGDLIATIMDGDTPVITASKSGGVTTIYANGVAIAQINDGASGSATLPDKNVVDDVSFSISGGKLKATLSKSNLKTGATSTVTKDVCDVSELDVVTEEAYSTSTHQFTNTRKRVKVIGTPSSAQGQTPFTATPLSGE